MPFDFPVVILHGWSDSSAPFVVIGNYLKSIGFRVVDVWLGDFFSINDQITLYDLGSAFRRTLEANRISQARHSFDLVVHSAGDWSLASISAKFASKTLLILP